MKVIKVYITLDEFSQYIKNKLPPEELADVTDCTFAPLHIGLNETDMSIEATIVAAKDGLHDNRRHRMTETQEEYEQLTFDFGDEV